MRFDNSRFENVMLNQFSIRNILIINIIFIIYKFKNIIIYPTINSARKIIS